jgi:uncharacterized protein involved in exopolysaccharide biosynthesis
MNATVTDTHDDELGVIGLVRRLWAARWLLIAVTAVFAVGGVVYALNLHNFYRASVALSPTNQSSSLMGSMAGGNLSNIASLVGLDVGGARNEKAVLALEVLRSRKFLTAFVDRRGIAVPLIAGKHLEDGKLFLDTTRYDPATKTWHVVNRDGTVGEPSQEMKFIGLSTLIDVKTDLRTGISVVSVEFLSPTHAAQWANWLVEDLNNHMRALDAQSAGESIRFLEQQAANTSLVGLQQMFFGLIEEQTKNLMLTHVQKDYVFDIVDPAVVPEIKSRPLRAFICIAITLGGFLFAIVIVLLRDFARALRRRVV